MEHRILLTQEEGFKISQIFEIKEVTFVKDTYTESKRIRTEFNDNTNHIFKTTEKEYITPIEGTTVRFSAHGNLYDIENVWFEVKWTENQLRFEIEFEDVVPEKYLNRPNIPGWEILK